MKPETVIRAWKDEAFRNGLSESERALLPENPAGTIELTDAQLNASAGGLRIGPTYDTACNTNICTQSGSGCSTIKSICDPPPPTTFGICKLMLA
jgi:mersacidin/lichenicidin family type 2 lantibiotic